VLSSRITMCTESPTADIIEPKPAVKPKSAICPSGAVFAGRPGLLHFKDSFRVGFGGYGYNAKGQEEETEMFRAMSLTQNSKSLEDARDSTSPPPPPSLANTI
jgi:hypothetical protein